MLQHPLNRLSFTGIAFTTLAFTAAQMGFAQSDDSISKSVEQIERLADREPFELGADTRLQAAAAVQVVDPKLSRRLSGQVATQLVAGDRKPSQYAGLLRELAAVDHDAAIRVLQKLPLDQPEQDPWPLLQAILAMLPTRPEEARTAARKLLAAHRQDPDLERAVAAIGNAAEPKQLNQILATHYASRAAAPDAALQERIQKISPHLKELRGNLGKAERAQLARSLATGIRALPPGAAQLGLANALSNLATEGDLGTDALQDVTTTLALAIRQAKPNVSGSQFLDLAKLVRYEHMQSPYQDPSLDARLEVLHLRDLTVEHAPLSLAGIDGKTYTLSELRGKVVLVNFWATWCPPCRKEMPDLEELSRRFQKQGLVVLAISDEPAATVKPFIEKQAYTFPVLLDPDRKVNDAFHVEGIPKSFVFDRNGHLATQSIDMRTQEQFLVLLKQAGLE